MLDWKHMYIITCVIGVYAYEIIIVGPICCNIMQV